MHLIFIYLNILKSYFLYFGPVLLLHAGSLQLQQAGAALLLGSIGSTAFGLSSCILGLLPRGRWNLPGPGMEPLHWQAES